MTSRKQLLPLFFTCLALLLGAGDGLANSVYKWVDEDGNVHFGQRPPENMESEVINADKPRSFGYGDNSQSSNDTADQPAPAAPDTAATEEETDEGQEKAEQVFKKDPEICKQAREHKAALMRSPVVRQGGKVLTMEEKNEALREANEVIKVHCEGEE